MEDLQIEGFAAWVLAAQLLSANPNAAAPPVQLQTIASEIVQSTSHERLVILDAEGKLVWAADGSKSRVDLPTDINTLVKDGTNRLHLIHNHPSGTSLSNDDIRLFLDSPGIKSISVATADGMLYTLTAAKSNAVSVYLSRYAAKEAEYRREWSGKKKLLKLADQILQDMHREGLVNYSSKRFR